ncbi:hypothetical protein [Planomonospora sp. ID82291]|uniref:hypothetical protein n=1 Tax=Planomonospora sp. ID82291 TaxID=2738136 RepID=UPI0018C39E33|nr:hypothetical protein [Planomonospora sp. ID82291]MBG0818343.1 hypothetical protein [Planomonospora sp. ID82291]
MINAVAPHRISFIDRAAVTSAACAMVTTPLTRRQLRRILLFGRLLGLAVEHGHDGGRWHRMHVVTASGSGDAAAVFTRRTGGALGDALFMLRSR